MKCWVPLCLGLLFPGIISAQFAAGPKNINGTRLFVSAEGKGETLIVLHGGPGLNHAYFKPHLNELHKTYRVVYYDQRASGKSAMPSEDSISIKMFVEDLEALRKFLGVKKVNLLAHSWGVVPAIQYSLSYPRQVNKLILSNPAMLSREFDIDAARLARERTSKEDSLRKAELVQSGSMDIKKYTDFFMLSFKASAYNPANLTRLNLDLQQNFQQANKILFTGLMKDPTLSKNLYDELERLKCPVLLISGSADIIPPASIEKLRSNLPKATVITMEKSGHFPFVEETAAFVAIVKKFLK